MTAIDPNCLGLRELYEHLSEGGLVSRLLAIARDEDLGPAGIDLTAASIDAPDRDVTATLRTREAATVAGLAALPDLLDAFDSDLEVALHASDGAAVPAGAEIATLEGPLSDVVAVERTALNLLGRLSGIATRTGAFIDAAGRRCRVLDTRKTTPGLRVLEKYAVRCGGGHLHRLGLYDAVLIKDNHIADVPPGSLAGFVSAAAARGRALGAAFVGVETDTLDQLLAVLSCAPGTVDMVLLDNMAPAMLREAVGLRDAAGSPVRLEASGGVTLDTIAVIAATGVDRVSVGSLTHSARSVDLGLDIASA
jgi:nicotinate-nucleotide pyrophosphorylase (carboxylating)